MVSPSSTSPNQRVPTWVLILIRQLPLVFLVLAIICSFVAIILIAFMPQQVSEVTWRDTIASLLNTVQQSLVTRIVTTILSAASCLGLLTILLWFLGELVVISRSDGRRLLVDVIGETEKLVRTFFVDLATNVWSLFKVKRLVHAEQSQQSLPFLWCNTNVVIDSGKDNSDREKGDWDQSTDQPDTALQSPVDSGIRQEMPFASSSSEASKGETETRAKARQRWKTAVERIIQEMRLPVHDRTLPLKVHDAHTELSRPEFLKKHHLADIMQGISRNQEVKRVRSMQTSRELSYTVNAGCSVHSLSFSPKGKLLFCPSIG